MNVYGKAYRMPLPDLSMQPLDTLQTVLLEKVPVSSDAVAFKGRVRTKKTLEACSLLTPVQCPGGNVWHPGLQDDTKVEQ